MLLSEFLSAYRKGVELATGKAFSVMQLSKILKVENYNLAKWEKLGRIPATETDRLKIKIFFGIADFETIGEDVLNSAIARYPKGLGNIEEGSAKTDNIPEQTRKANAENGGSGTISDTILVSPPKNTSMEETLLTLAQTLANNAADDRAIIKLLITKIPDAELSGLRLNKKSEKVPEKVK